MPHRACCLSWANSCPGFVQLRWLSVEFWSVLTIADAHEWLIHKAVNIALLTIYDMDKAAGRGMTMTGVKLLEKHGGKSGSYLA